MKILLQAIGDPVNLAAAAVAPPVRLHAVRSYARAGALALAALVLTACGGGGGGGSSSNSRPTASFTATPTSGTIPLTVSFNAGASTDSDGSIATYAWNFGDGGTASGSGATATHTYSTAGTYTASLTVTDNDGATAQTTRTVTASAPNLPPTASFLFTPTSGTAPLLVSFNGTPSSDPEGPIATYTWDFGDGSATVVGATPSHTYVAAGSYTIQLTVADAQGLTASTTRNLTVTTAGGGGNVTISGRVTYDRVPFGTTVNAGLNYAATSQQPVREAVVQFVVGIGGGILASSATDSSGNYALSVPASTSGFVRVRAQSLRTTTPTRNVQVKNNTGSGLPVYVLDGSVFNTGTAASTRNLNAASGWGGSGYTSTRAAAPFAILDSMVSAVNFVLDEGGATTNLPSLDVYWSVLNTVVDGDVTLGQIGTTLYSSGSTVGTPAGIYVLGDDNLDTDEYDQHVMVHEFQHFLEDAITRSESPGDEHAINDRLDLRLAFSEGFANAFSAMVLNDPIYRDSLGNLQASGFSVNFEDNSFGPPADWLPGWFNEGSIVSLVWDLFDTAADGVDTVALGFQPMFEVLTGTMNSTPALTSIYPFITALKAQAGAPVAGINSLVSSQSIVINDAWATGEANSGGVGEALPIYTSITPGGTQRVCGVTTAGTYNRIGNRVFLRFTLGSARSVTIQALYTDTGSLAPFTPASDPDLVLYRSGFLDFADSTTIGSETLTRSLEAGDYVIEVYEYSHVDPAGSPPRGKTCFNVTVN